MLMLFSACENDAERIHGRQYVMKDNDDYCYLWDIQDNGNLVIKKYNSPETIVFRGGDCMNAIGFAKGAEGTEYKYETYKDGDRNILKVKMGSTENIYEYRIIDEGNALILSAEKE